MLCPTLFVVDLDVHAGGALAHGDLLPLADPREVLAVIEHFRQLTILLDELLVHQLLAAIGLVREAVDLPIERQVAAHADPEIAPRVRGGAEAVLGRHARLDDLLELAHVALALARLLDVDVEALLDELHEHRVRLGREHGQRREDLVELHRTVQRFERRLLEVPRTLRHLRGALDRRGGDHATIFHGNESFRLGVQEDCSRERIHRDEPEARRRGAIQRGRRDQTPRALTLRVVGPRLRHREQEVRGHRPPTLPPTDGRGLQEIGQRNHRVRLEIRVLHEIETVGLDPVADGDIRTSQVDRTLELHPFGAIGALRRDELVLRELHEVPERRGVVLFRHVDRQDGLLSRLVGTDHHAGVRDDRPGRRISEIRVRVDVSGQGLDGREVEIGLAQEIPHVVRLLRDAIAIAVPGGHPAEVGLGGVRVGVGIVLLLARHRLGGRRRAALLRLRQGLQEVDATGRGAILNHRHISSLTQRKMNPLAQRNV